MSQFDKKRISKIINEHPDDIEVQIRLMRYSFDIPRGHAIAILENFNQPQTHKQNLKQENELKK